MSTPRLKVMTVLGTRPEIIRLSRVIARLDETTDHVLVHTGQNYDFELNEVFFRDLGVRKPDHFLAVDTASLGATLGDVLRASETVMRAESPDAVLILGDTNSALAGIIARRLKIPLYHMEAGNRCFDRNVPEELNRRIIDHISDFNLVYTEHARRHLIAEGLEHRRIYVTGSPMREVLDHHRDDIAKSDVLVRLDLEEQQYFLASIHREENVDNSEQLGRIVDTLERLVARYSIPVVVSTHPRTRDRLQKLGRKNLPGDLRFLKPFGFLDYNKLQMHARCVISDSGTICEESAILGFPAITPRVSIERPEAMDAGTIVVTGLDADTIEQAVALQTSRETRAQPARLPWEYQVADTSHRVVKLIVGTARLSHQWDNIRRNDLA